ncbi:poly(R)-hydroxyalkanoic acid synthase subunit PhaE [Dyella sp. A6]|uniref:poly(R)-hydroxyalkanoic acid synthase subunit PhaE n=1 Tax=Dyella aluminiiresistens TaxID=3069105 RepID=UPI002E75B0E7|nr:poly(R)-hydroxyalkanoic acid synthase subunit PhaE [Dyella sp. A6]
MADQASDFLKDWQAMAKESWDAWMRRTAQPQAASNPFAAGFTGPDELLAQGMAGAKAYMDWLQNGVVGSNVPPPPSNWIQQMQQIFGQAMAGSAGQPFGQGFPPAGMPGMSGMPPGMFAGHAAPWESWWSNPPQGMPGVEPVAAFGYTREQQLQQQALAAAMAEYLETMARYQALMQKVHAQGSAVMQQKFEQLAVAGQSVQSMKALYDLWVDAIEEAFAELALSDEFREAFGAMSNAQMRLRQQQQQQIEQWCSEQGIPTRSEVNTLGQRLQELRRELRTRESAAVVAGLREELAALKRRLEQAEARSVPTVKAAARPAAGKTAKATSTRRKATTTRRSQAAGRRK